MKDDRYDEKNSMLYKYSSNKNGIFNKLYLVHYLLDLYAHVHQRMKAIYIMKEEKACTNLSANK